MAGIKQIRMQAIVEILKKRAESGASYEEIYQELARHFENRDLEFRFSERTFERDKKDLAIERKLYIEYRRTTNTYHISWDEINDVQESLMDSYWLIEAIRDSKYPKDFMIFEKRPQRGLNWLHGLIYAIENKRLVSFDYYKFKENTTEKHTVEPYALKEFNYHWYLLANDCKTSDFAIKVFALDRISNFNPEQTSFVPKEYDPREDFKHFYGVINLYEKKPIEICLHFDRHQGNYVKVMPWHSSQIIEKDDDNGLVIKLFLVPTYDFDLKIVSQANRVKVLSPPAYREHIKSYFLQALDRYDTV